MPHRSSSSNWLHCFLFLNHFICWKVATRCSCNEGRIGASFSTVTSPQTALNLTDFFLASYRFFFEVQKFNTISALDRFGLSRSFDDKSTHFQPKSTTCELLFPRNVDTNCSAYPVCSCDRFSNINIGETLLKRRIPRFFFGVDTVVRRFPYWYNPFLLVSACVWGRSCRTGFVPKVSSISIVCESVELYSSTCACNASKHDPYVLWTFWDFLWLMVFAIGFSFLWAASMSAKRVVVPASCLST